MANCSYAHKVTARLHMKLICKRLTLMQPESIESIMNIEILSQNTEVLLINLVVLLTYNHKSIITKRINKLHTQAYINDTQCVLRGIKKC